MRLWPIRYIVINAPPSSTALGNTDSSTSVQDTVWLNYFREYCLGPYVYTAAARLPSQLPFQVSSDLPDIKAYGYNSLSLLFWFLHRPLRYKPLYARRLTKPQQYDRDNHAVPSEMTVQNPIYCISLLPLAISPT